jgi:hypothetical protein
MYSVQGLLAMNDTEIGVLLPNSQRQCRTCLRDALRTVPRVGRSCEQFPDGFFLHLLQAGGARTLSTGVPRS